MDILKTLQFLCLKNLSLFEKYLFYGNNILNETRALYNL